MTTIQQIEKHYDKLTARERFALMVKADARGDDIQVKALLKSAPRKSFSFPHTHGLSDGFDFLVMCHIMAQLNNIASFYFLVLSGHDETATITIGETSYTIDDVFNLLHRNMIGGRDAFGVICQEYNLDPDELLGNYPYQMTIGTGEIFANIGAQDMGEAEQAELKRYTQETIEAYREAIKHHTQGWE